MNPHLTSDSKAPPKVIVDSAEIPRTRKHRKKNWQCTFDGCTDPLKTRYNCYSHIWDTHLRKVFCESQPDVFENTTYKNVKDKEKVKSLCEPYMTQLVSDKKRVDSDDGEDDINDVKQEYPLQNNNYPNPQDNENIQYTQQQYNTQFQQFNQANMQNGNSYINQTIPNENNMYNIQQQWQHQQEQTQPQQWQQQLQPQQWQQQEQTQPQQLQTQPLQQMETIQQVSNQNDWDKFVNDTSTMATQQFLNDELQNGDFMKIYNISNNLHRLHVYGEVLAENGYFVRSDERMKCHIKPLSDCLENIIQLVGKQYRYKNSPQMRLGFVAQEVKQVLPELVHTDDNGTLSVDVLGVVPFLVESLKQLDSEISSLDGVNGEQFQFLQSRIVDALELTNELRIRQQKEKTDLTLDKNKEPIYTFAFAPAPVALYFAALFTIICFILPFTYEYQYVMWMFCGAITFSLYLSLVLQWKDVWKMVRYHQIRWEWTTYHFFTMYLFAFLFLLSVSFTVLMGSVSYQFSAAACIINLSFCVVASTFVSFLVIVFLAVGVVYCIQPTYICSINDYGETSIVSMDSQQQLILTLSPIPFNCFNSTLLSTLPEEMTLTPMDKNNVFLLEGNITKQTDYIDFYLQCSKFISFHCGSHIFQP
ncbi:Peptidase S74 domain-containing protein [Entamoeba marina]